MGTPAEPGHIWDDLINHRNVIDASRKVAAPVALCRYRGRGASPRSCAFVQYSARGMCVVAMHNEEAKEGW
jgi:hypothetical protein